MVKLKLSLRTLFGRYHDLDNCFDISDVLFVVITIPSPFSFFMTYFLREIRRMLLVEQEMIAFPVHMSSPKNFKFCFLDHCMCIYPFLFVLRFTTVSYDFGILKRFFSLIKYNVSITYRYQIYSLKVTESKYISIIKKIEIIFKFIFE